MNEHEELLTADMAAQLIGVGRGAIYRAGVAGVLPSQKVGRIRLYRPADVQAWFGAGNYHADKAAGRLGKRRKRGPGRPRKRKSFHDK